MLRRLLISDFVLVDRLELDFRPGFGVLTGETGAGKSILLDALALLLGERAEAGVVRAGSERADVAAEFDLPEKSPAKAWLLSQDFNADENEVLIRRVVDSGGRSRAYVNGMPATAAQLRDLGEFLADIHGQHAHHALLRGDAQRQLLDAHAGLSELAREVATLYKTWQAARRAREEAEQGQASLVHERELLSFQVKELAELAFASAEWEALNQEHSRLSHAASLLEGVEAALDSVSESEAPLSTETQRITARLQELAQYDASLDEVAELLSEAAIRLDEAGHALRRYRDHVDLDPERLTEVEQRIAAVMTMARKYRVQPEELDELLKQSRTRLDNRAELADAAAMAEREQAAFKAFSAQAKILSAKRATAAAKLGKSVTAAMQDLAMAGGRFELALLPDPEGSASGFERIEFQVAANPNQPLRPLSKVASGGELSRIGLAIQVITSEAQSTPTLIFDEVDVGIGGSVAEIVGRRLRELGQGRQVLCVTHLPQVAAQANWQWKVAKETVGSATLSRLTELDDAGRVEEIARMLGGVNIT
ncbi:MAG TPA: DNA repair protein RecN, partial [Rhodocyclaceae bacterium]|nr:DNA repair protein RecN [Rhodocyclaceae bacterium]